MANPRAIQLSAMDQLILQRRFDNERKVKSSYLLITRMKRMNEINKLLKQF